MLIVYLEYRLEYRLNSMRSKKIFKHINLLVIFYVIQFLKSIYNNFYYYFKLGIQLVNSLFRFIAPSRCLLDLY